MFEKTKSIKKSRNSVRKRARTAAERTDAVLDIFLTRIISMRKRTILLKTPLSSKRGRRNSLFYSQSNVV